MKALKGFIRAQAEHPSIFDFVKQRDKLRRLQITSVRYRILAWIFGLAGAELLIVTGR
jgi:hypothetical protein